MKLALLLCGSLAAGLLATQAQADNMYRWTDADGKVHYTDQPPPEAAKKVEEKNISGGVATDTSNLPYASRVAMKKAPVTLYVNDCGTPCKEAKDFLGKRGVPYTTKNPQTSTADADALKKVAGELVVPVLTVGGAVNKGFESGAWNATLDAAGYPKEGSVLKPKAEEKVEKKKEEPAPPAHPWAK
ncbi:MAG: glutaredoxin family protein [Sulfuricellaceae bacterium]|nr:glutaredoxin family protein [Sulfuricellaceae bacterium]